MDRKQLSLFQEFICPQQAVREDMSNTLMFWDALPKYHIPREIQRQLADSNGRLSIFRRDVRFRDETYTMEIYPAKIVRDGVEMDVYPGETEELVEDVLRKFLADQNQGFFNTNTKTAHVYFTLDQVKKELKQRGKNSQLSGDRRGARHPRRQRARDQEGQKGGHQGRDPVDHRRPAGTTISPIPAAAGWPPSTTSSWAVSASSIIAR